MQLRLAFNKPNWNVGCQYRRKHVIFLLVAGALYMQRQRTISAWLSGGTRETPAQRHIGHIHLVTSWRTCDTRHRPQMWQAQRARTVSLRGSVAPHLARDLLALFSFISVVVREQIRDKGQRKIALVFAAGVGKKLINHAKTSHEDSD